jgi:hypothetical protein
VVEHRVAAQQLGRAGRARGLQDLGQQRHG